MKYLVIYFFIIMSLYGSDKEKSLEIGSSVPNVEAYNHEGEKVNLMELVSGELSIVFFYPKALTPGCTMQACSLRDTFIHIKDINIIGISADSPEIQMKFKSKHNLPYTLIADSSGEINKAFKKNKWARHAYIFNETKLVWKDTKGKTFNQGSEIIKALKELNLR